ncbi:ROK family transcriptional regulator [Tateyamaria sp. SN6-1]|uniref:ROK family transcriptional regulator n=1 Tax=Tateyamaria sp. SN6-1 TaxID=3092148 RepID=UPI0039F5857B
MTLDHVRSLAGGINQSGVRAYNERLLLSVMQRNGGLSGVELARRTGLSPQTTSVILRKLEQDGLLKRGASVKGKVGKPSVPFSLHPDGAFSMGLKLGRRSADLVVLDLAGQVRQQLRQTYDYPRPGPILDFLHMGFQDLTSEMSEDMAARLCGLGISAPFELWNWHEVLGANAADFAAWKDADIVSEAAELTGLPVRMVNDATAACRAEHIFGIGREYRDYVYFFVGAFIGGGIVLDHAVFEGNQSNAGAFGSLMVPDRAGRARPLIDVASIRSLERRLEDVDLDPRQLWETPQDWTHLEEHVGPWVEETADALAAASVAASAVIDVEAIVIDGGMPESIRKRLVRGAAEAMGQKDTRGLIAPEIVEGQIGGNARGIGAAVGPIINQYLLDRPAALFEQS